MYTLRWLRLAALGALFFSAAAAVDLVLDAPAFCGVGGGCDAVKNSSVGQMLGQYLPGFGLFAFSAVFWGTLVPLAQVRKLTLLATLLGGVFGIGFIAAQWISAGTFCQLCVAADAFAILAALFAVVALRGGQMFVTTWPWNAWAAMFVIAVGLPVAYGVARPVPMPHYVKARLTPDAVDVIEVSDFECPYCRALHGVLGPLLTEFKGRIRFERLTFPLPGHRHAVIAARSYVCAKVQGKGEQMADFLFTESDLSVEAIEKHADAIGLDRALFNGCRKSAGTLNGIMAVHHAVAKQGIRGVPVVWIEGRRIAGFDKNKGDAPYRQALTEALAGRPVGMQPLPFVALGLIVAILVTISARNRKD